MHCNYFVGCCTCTVHCMHNLNNVQTALMLALFGQLLRSVNSGCTYAVHSMHNLNHVHKALIQCIVYIIYITLIRSDRFSIQPTVSSLDNRGEWSAWLTGLSGLWKTCDWQLACSVCLINCHHLNGFDRLNGTCMIRQVCTCTWSESLMSWTVKSFWLDPFHRDSVSKIEMKQ